MGRKVVTGKFADVSNRLRAIRAYYDMSSIDFARGAGVPHKSYSQWESGGFRLSLDGAMRLRERYGISLDFMYFGSLDTLHNKIAVALSSNPETKAMIKSTVNPEE